jgi:hypothetical protein
MGMNPLSALGDSSQSLLPSLQARIESQLKLPQRQWRRWADLSLVGLVMILFCNWRREQSFPLQRFWLNHAGDLVMNFEALDLHRQARLIRYAFSGEFHSAEQPERIQLRQTFNQLIRSVLG